MIDAALDLQKALRARLVATSAVTALVSADAIVDRNARPEIFPCILLGEGMSQPDDGIARNRHEVHADLHIWVIEESTVIAKQITGAIRGALSDGSLTLDHHHVADAYIASTRFLRDPDGVHSHAVVTFYARLVELTETT